jgi:hypothetical protein
MMVAACLWFQEQDGLRCCRRGGDRGDEREAASVPVRPGRVCPSDEFCKPDVSMLTLFPYWGGERTGEERRGEETENIREERGQRRGQAQERGEERSGRWAASGAPFRGTPRHRYRCR